MNPIVKCALVNTIKLVSISVLFVITGLSLFVFSFAWPLFFGLSYNFIVFWMFAYSFVAITICLSYGAYKDEYKKCKEKIEGKPGHSLF